MKSTVLIGIFALGVAAAGPPGFSSTDYNATFEYTDSSIIMAAAVPGPYNALQWNMGIGPFNYQAGDCAGVCPESFPVEIIFRYTDAIGSASVTSKYPSSKVISFAMHDFYFGCQADQIFKSPDDGQDITVQVPSNCTLTVQGYGVGGSRIPIAGASFKYVPSIRRNRNTGAPNAVMTKAVLPESFRGLTLLTFNSSGVVAPYVSAPTVLMDSFSYTVLNSTLP